MSKGKILTTVAAVSVAAMMTVDVYAAGWQHNMTGWWYGTNEANTTWHANGWQWIDGNNDGIAECITSIRTAICSLLQLRRMALL